MSPARRIVISGTSLFLLAIEAGLAALSELEVTHIDPHLPRAAGCIVALEPDVVLVDRSAEALARTLRQLDVPIIEVDARETKLHVSAKTSMSPHNTDDLLRAIESAVVASGEAAVRKRTATTA